jgi:hypothetical protein
MEGAAGLTQQISYALRLTESGTPVAGVKEEVRQAGIGGTQGAASAA